MATTDGLPPDPLLLLRRCITSNQPLPILAVEQDASTAADTTTSLAQANYLIFNTQSAQDGAQHISIPLTQQTRFINQGGKALDLRSVYVSWQNRDSNSGVYFAAITAINAELEKLGKQDRVVNLVFQERVDLSDWLAGKTAEEASEYIRSLDANKQVRREAADAAAAAKGGEDVEMRDADLVDGAAAKREQERLREIYAAERKLSDRNLMLRGVKVQDFSADRKKYSVLFFAKTRAQQQAPALTGNPALRPPVSHTKPGRRPEPIILLSPSASSLLRMPNIKSFLEDGQYIPPESETSGTNILHLMRTLPSVNPSKPLRFILVDDPSSFRPDYWDRVVAVFTTGQTWQFKNYKWQQPAELFSHALGIYVGWKGEVVPDTVKGWGRGVMVAQIDKGTARWRDREVVEEIWRNIEARMRAIGWGKDGR
jgi:parafibromin